MATSSLETQTPMGVASDSEYLSESKKLDLPIPMDCFHHEPLSEFGTDTVVPETRSDESELQTTDDDGEAELVVPEIQLTLEPMVPETPEIGFDDLDDVDLTYDEWTAKYIARGLPKEC